MFKTYIFLFAIVFLQFNFATAQIGKFNSYEGKFSIQFPGEVTEQAKEIETTLGTMAYHTFYHNSTEEDATNFIYLVSYVDYPDGAIHSDSTELIEEFFQATLEESVLNMNGDLRYSDEIKLFDYPGRFWRIDYNEDSMVMKTKAFLVKNRYYSIQVGTLKELATNLDMDKFLESFNLLSSE